MVGCHPHQVSIKPTEIFPKVGYEAEVGVNEKLGKCWVFNNCWNIQPDVLLLHEAVQEAGLSSWPLLVYVPLHQGLLSSKSVHKAE